MALTRITKGVIKPNENYDTHNINSTGIITAVGANFTGDVSVGGVLTYEDVTSIDSVGIITAQKGIHVGTGVSAVGVGTFGGLVSPYADIDDFLDVGSNIQLGNAGVVTATTFKGDGDFVDLDVDGHTNLDNVSIAGVTTFSDDVTLTGVSGGTSGSAIWDKSDKSLNIGNNAFLKFGSTTYSGGHQLQIYQATSTGFSIFKSLNNNRIAYHNDKLYFNNQANNTALARIESAEGVSLYYTGTKRLQTSGIGITVTGSIVASGDLDVDGHTNLDNVSVAGVTTFAGDIRTQNIFPSGSNLDIGSSSNPFRDIHLSNDLSLIDSGLLKLVTDNDFLIQSTGNNNFIEGGSGFSGNLYLRA